MIYNEFLSYMYVSNLGVYIYILESIISHVT